MVSSSVKVAHKLSSININNKVRCVVSLLSGKVPLRLMSSVFSIGVALGAGISYGTLKGNSQQVANVKCTSAEPINVSRVDYERLELNMSQSEVESILDPGVETSRSENAVHMMWENCDSSRIVVKIENGVLKHKEQLGLK